MKRFLAAVLFCFPLGTFALSVSVMPETVIQGEPVRVMVENVNRAEVRRILFDGSPLGIFVWQGKLSAFVGIDLNGKVGERKIVVEFSDGTTLEKKILVGERKKWEAPLGIPEKLGGNTPQAATRLVNELTRENRTLHSLWSQPKALWTEKFVFPVAKPEVTDTYGYVRQTVGTTVAHKGTDFRASERTFVMAMNRGVVRFARQLPVYGGTVVIDHGLGLQTLYMHLSKLKVSVGELVRGGQVIALSGDTGYASGPHLHISVWLGGISVDPMKFLSLF